MYAKAGPYATGYISGAVSRIDARDTSPNDDVAASPSGDGRRFAPGIVNARRGTPVLR
jgi:hypothetical protein